MSEYTPISLGDILAQAGQIKAQQQRGQMGALQLAEAQKTQQDQQGIDSALLQNPNADLSTLIKAGGGMAGVKASTDIGSARTQDSQFQTLQQLHSLQQQKFLTDQVVADPTKMPQVAQQLQSIGVQGHADGWEHLPPQQIQANAAQASQALTAQIQALTEQLVPPDKRYDVQHQDQRNANTIAGDNQRNAATIAAENARAVAERAQQARGQSITMRGQDLEAGRSNKPQLVEVPNADGTTTKKWLIPGQLEGPTVGTSPPGAKLSETQGNAKAFGLRAQDANATLEAMITGPNAYNPTGLAAAKDAAAAGGAANFLASDAGQKYQNVAKAFIAPILRKESGAAISESEWKSAKQLYIPIPGDSQTVLDQKARNRADAIEGLRVQAGPTGLPDVKAPTGSPTAASAQPSAVPPPPQRGALVKGYRFKGGDPSKQENWVKSSG